MTQIIPVHFELRRQESDLYSLIKFLKADSCVSPTTPFLLLYNSLKWTSETEKAKQTNLRLEYTKLSVQATQAIKGEACVVPHKRPNGIGTDRLRQENKKGATCKKHEVHRCYHTE